MKRSRNTEAIKSSAHSITTIVRKASLQQCSPYEYEDSAVLNRIMVKLGFGSYVLNNRVFKYILCFMCNEPEFYRFLQDIRGAHLS